MTAIAASAPRGNFPHMLLVAASTIAALFAVGTGWFVASRFTLVTPSPTGRANVVRSIPDDFPAIEGADVIEAGAGGELAYRLTYTPARAEDVLAQLHSARGWTATSASTLDEIELLHRAPDGSIDYIARFTVTEHEDGHPLVSAEFSPLPTRLAPARER